jgi:hypothetical protein
MDTHTIRGDKEAERRMEIKKEAEGARRAMRYQRYVGEKPGVKLSKQEAWAVNTMKRSMRTA